MLKRMTEEFEDDDGESDAVLNKESNVSELLLAVCVSWLKRTLGGE